MFDLETDKIHQDILQKDPKEILETVMKRLTPVLLYSRLLQAVKDLFDREFGVNKSLQNKKNELNDLKKKEEDIKKLEKELKALRENKTVDVPASNSNQLIAHSNNSDDVYQIQKRRWELAKQEEEALITKREETILSLQQEIETLKKKHMELAQELKSNLNFDCFYQLFNKLCKGGYIEQYLKIDKQYNGESLTCEGALALLNHFGYLKMQGRIE